MPEKHIHQYKRIDIGVLKEYLVYRCMLPDCSHYITPNLIEGKESLCNRCKDPFIIDKDSKNQASPHCANCTIRKEAIA